MSGKRWNVWVGKKDGSTQIVRLGGCTRLTSGQVRWLQGQYRSGSRGWTGFRKRQIEMPTTLGQRALAAARLDLGIREIGGNNRGPEVEAIIKGNGGAVGEPWCGDAVATWYRKAGSKCVQRGWAAVRLLGFLSGMRRVKHPKPGDIVCFAFDHTGLFVRFGPNGTLVTIEGNTGTGGARSDSGGGDGVHQRTDRTRSQVSRYVRVLR